MAIRTIALLLLWTGCDGTRALDANTGPNAQTHDQYFPISSGTHGGIDCNTCHGAFDSFTQFDCTNGCHAQADTDPSHTGVAGYTYQSAACYSCHPKGTGVDHNNFFPIGAGTHHNIPCGDCHTDPSNHSVFTCVSGNCHPQSQTDSDHGDVGGYMYISANCYGCHFRGQQ